MLVFDVNETLLDLVALRDPFTRAFGDAAPMGEWFARLLHCSLVATVTDSYEDFASIGRRALDAVASRRGRELTQGQRQRRTRTSRDMHRRPSKGFRWGISSRRWGRKERVATERSLP